MLGEKETINGIEYYTVKTNERGELTADLPDGLYKAVELEAPEQYDISKEYYFGIGASRKGKEGAVPEWTKVVGGDKNNYIISVSETSDGGYITGGYFSSSSINLGIGTEGRDIIVDNTGSGYDGLIIKYRSDGAVEWAKVVGGDGDDYIYTVSETSDEGYIAGGYFKSSSINLGEGVNGKQEVVENNGSHDGLIIKYRSDRVIEWTKVVGGDDEDKITSVSETSDGSYIAGGYFKSSSINLGVGVSGEKIVSCQGRGDGLIIKYGSDGVVEWAKVVGGTGDDEISSVASTSDGYIIAGGHFNSSSINLGNGTEGRNVIVDNTKSGLNDGLIIKYGSDGVVEWAKVVGGTSDDEISSVALTSDGGYIVGGHFKSSSINLGVGTEGIDEIVDNTGSNSYDGLIIKYNVNGVVEWEKVVRGTKYDYIGSVASTSDGGIIAGGRFNSDIITLEGAKGEEVVVNKNDQYYYDGIIIKYRSDGVAEWAKVVGGRLNDYIGTVLETSVGGYIAGGFFSSSSINLGIGKDGEDVIVTGGGSLDGIIIKYTPVEMEKTVVKHAKITNNISTVSETSDGGYIAGGYFKISSINLGAGTDGRDVIVDNKRLL